MAECISSQIREKGMTNIIRLGLTANAKNISRGKRVNLSLYFENTFEFKWLLTNTMATCIKIRILARYRSQLGVWGGFKKESPASRIGTIEITNNKAINGVNMIKVRSYQTPSMNSFLSCSNICIYYALKL
jgi:hypothetical protein